MTANYKTYECCGGGGPSELAGHRHAGCYRGMQMQYQAERARKCTCPCHRILPGMDPNERSLFDGCDDCISKH